MVNDVLKLKSSWEKLKSTSLPIVLYGTGNGADKVIDELERLGIKLSGVTASDGFVRTRSFRGFEVKPLNSFEKEYGDFIVIIGFGTNRDEVIDNIKSIRERHRVLVPCVPVYGGEIFNREFMEKHENELEAVYSMLADEKSKEVFVDFLKFELTGELDYLFNSETDKSEAFRNILKLGKNENYLDLGAYRGDTVDEFLKYTDGKYASITALEPNKKSFEKLKAHTLHLKNCNALNLGIYSTDCSLGFDNDFGRGSSAVIFEGGQAVTSVDLLSAELNIAFSYIKADVEGCEYEMLIGAENTLKSCKPKLNIAAYHRSADIFALPLMIKKANSDYRIFLRHHRYIPCWDLNLYCI
ncbi:MAG: FkbM family methyltransferase [Clostridiaceae bacterium]|nr:FkbM family methyltransferase [Clostridiaceae bacterium]